MVSDSHENPGGAYTGSVHVFAEVAGQWREIGGYERSCQFTDADFAAPGAAQSLPLARDLKVDGRVARFVGRDSCDGSGYR